jgi:hypothetical protein
MQNIYPTSLTPAQYAQQEYHKQVLPPENCPNCGRAHTLEALAYYQRYVTYLLVVLRICVRRFLCRQCRVSVSCLPAFAQPYRAINTATVEAGFSGPTQGREVQHWGALIAVYWTRFATHLPWLLRQLGNAFGPVPLQPTAEGFWPHPHIHALVTEGVFLPDGTFLPLPKLATEPFLKLWEETAARAPPRREVAVKD